MTILSFSCCYFFTFCEIKQVPILINKLGWNIKEKVPLFGFWFISSRVIYAVGYLLTTLTGLNFKVPGVALMYGLLSLMVA